MVSGGLTLVKYPKDKEQKQQQQQQTTMSKARFWAGSSSESESEAESSSEEEVMNQKPSGGKFGMVYESDSGMKPIL